jgi:hypothetical protein
MPTSRKLDMGCLRIAMGPCHIILKNRHQKSSKQLVSHPRLAPATPPRQYKTVHPKTLCFRFWREAKNISRQNWLYLDTNFDETTDRPYKHSLLKITLEMNPR